MRYQVQTDWRRFDREFAVVDTLTMGQDGHPEWVLQTRTKQRADEFAAELNAAD